MCAVTSINYTGKAAQKIDNIKQNNNTLGVKTYVDKYIESYPTNIKAEEMDLNKIYNETYDISKSKTIHEIQGIMNPMNEIIEILSNTNFGKNTISDMLKKVNIIISSDDIQEVIKTDYGSITVKTQYGDITLNSDGTTIVGDLLIDTNTIGTDNITVTQDGIVITTINGKWYYNETTGYEYKGFDGTYYKCDDLNDVFAQNGIQESNLININNINVENDNSLFISSIDGLYRFDSEGRIIYYSDGETTTVYNYNPTEEEKKELYDLYGMDPSTPVNFIATTTIRGHEIKYYSAGEQADNSAAVAPIHYSKQYSKYSDETLSKLDENFFGIIICPWENASNPECENKAGAYAQIYYDDSFIYIPSNVNFNSAYYSINTPTHEMAHILQDIAIENNTFDTEGLETLFNEYKDEMSDMPWSSYTDSTGFTESPNSVEFFADASTNYFQDPETLQRYMPELYEFMEDFYG